MHPELLEEEGKPFEPPLAPNQHLDVFIYGHHTKAPSGHFIHGFGVQYVRSPGGLSELFLSPVSDKSEEGIHTNNMRGLLGALLTAVRRIESNQVQSHVAGIYSDEEYVTRHLPNGIERWCTDPARANVDLLKLLLPYCWAREKLAPLAEPKQVRPLAVDPGEPTALSADFEFKIEQGIPMPDAARRDLCLAELKEAVAAHLNDYIRKHYP
jgi:hypothetical protein